MLGLVSLPLAKCLSLKCRQCQNACLWPWAETSKGEIGLSVLTNVFGVWMHSLGAGWPWPHAKRRCIPTRVRCECRIKAVYLGLCPELRTNFGQAHPSAEMGSHRMLGAGRTVGSARRRARSAQTGRRESDSGHAQGFPRPLASSQKGKGQTCADLPQSVSACRAAPTTPTVFQQTLQNQCKPVRRKTRSISFCCHVMLNGNSRSCLTHLTSPSSSMVMTRPTIPLLRSGQSSKSDSIGSSTNTLSFTLKGARATNEPLSRSRRQRS